MGFMRRKMAIEARTRKVVRALFFVVASLGVLAAPVLAITLRKQPKVAGVAIAGVFALLATSMSIWAIARHVEADTEPTLQRYIVRILAMVPIYALNSFAALTLIALELNPSAAFYLNTPRECYEAFVIYRSSHALQPLR
jgi:hypothetical protein